MPRQFAGYKKLAGSVGSGRSIRATLAQAMKITVEIESLCGVYLQALSVGPPALLNGAQMAEVIEKFKHYGRSARRDGVA